MAAAEKFVWVKFGDMNNEVGKRLLLIETPPHRCRCRCRRPAADDHNAASCPTPR